jgi:hypothetical protein
MFTDNMNSFYTELKIYSLVKCSMFPLSKAAIFSPLGFSLPLATDHLCFKPHLNYGKIHAKLEGLLKMTLPKQTSLPNISVRILSILSCFIESLAKHFCDEKS